MPQHANGTHMYRSLERVPPAAILAVLQVRIATRKVARAEIVRKDEERRRSERDASLAAMVVQTLGVVVAAIVAPLLAEKRSDG